jgi:hypothetical protein
MATYDRLSIGPLTKITATAKTSSGIWVSGTTPIKTDQQIRWEIGKGRDMLVPLTFGIVFPFCPSESTSSSTPPSPLLSLAYHVLSKYDCHPLPLEALEDRGYGGVFSFFVYLQLLQRPFDRMEDQSGYFISPRK